MIDETFWSELAAAPGVLGVSVRLLNPASQHDLYLMVMQPGDRRVLALRTDRRIAEAAMRTIRRLPQTRGLELRFEMAVDGRHELRLTLNDRDLREVFTPLVSDIAVAVNSSDTGELAVVSFVRRFDRWREMLQTLADNGMTADSRRGLFGELYVLRQHLLPRMSSLAAVEAWTGPTGSPQDFQLPRGAIEVKTSSGKQPHAIAVANERELDDRGAGTLLLLHLALDERRGGQGESLNGLVDDIQSRLERPAAVSLLTDLLVQAHYLPHQRPLYDEPRYFIRQQQLWRVEGTFPRIVESDLRPGVGACSYRIQTAGLDRFLAAPTVIDYLVGES